MTQELALFYGEQALVVTLEVAGPLLITALVVGSVISVLQAVTQVQEITLVFVPKILASFLVLALMGGYMLQTLVALGTEMFLSIPQAGGG
ncbi:MAG: flagellar biosynthetic protein FliQ [Deltaproteobacteria bacterium]|nr:flagellar biosynthetic protein FliQ [Deltaproteobacteria bacterium]